MDQGSDFFIQCKKSKEDEFKVAWTTYSYSREQMNRHCSKFKLILE